MASRPAMSGRRVVLRGSGVVLGSAVLLVVAWLAVCHAALDDPRVDRPRASDAVLVLGPPDPTRMEKAVELVTEHHIADTLVISAPNPLPGESPRLTAYASARKFCGPYEGVEVICFAPDPATTQGEAMELRELARQRSWHTVTAVTFEQHVPRARMILRRCFHGELRMSAVDYRLTGLALVRQYVRESAGFVKAWLTPGCDQQLPWKPRSLD